MVAIQIPLRLKNLKMLMFWLRLKLTGTMKIGLDGDNYGYVAAPKIGLLLAWPVEDPNASPQALNDEFCRHSKEFQQYLATQN